jgi:hypothetical protein
MTKRLMNDRDHLENLLSAVEVLLADKEVQYTVGAGPSVQRLKAAAERAAQDLYPEG